MKKIVLCVMILLIGISLQAQPMLGQGRKDVMELIKNDNDLTFLQEGISTGGNPYITAAMPGNDICGWYFSNGVVDQYKIIIDADDLNGYISYCNSKFVSKGSFQWIDYSSGTATYWYLISRDEYYNVIASKSKLEI